MSPIGRIFIIVNLVLSAAFFGWAGSLLSVKDNYFKQLNDEKAAHKTDVEAKDKDLAALQVKLDSVTDEGRRSRELKDSAQAQADQLKTQLDELKRLNDSLQGNVTKIQSTLGDYNATITNLSSQKDAAIERAHDAERKRDEAMQQKQGAEIAQRDAEEASKNSQLKIGDLEKEKGGLQEQVDTLNTRLQVVMAKTGINAKDVFAQPQIDAMVLEVKRDLKLVVLNKGRKDEVKPGYVFDVYSGSKYKGQVRINDVQNEMSSGLILNEANAIARGDNATTSLN